MPRSPSEAATTDDAAASFDEKLNDRVQGERRPDEQYRPNNGVVRRGRPCFVQFRAEILVRDDREDRAERGANQGDRQDDDTEQDDQFAARTRSFDAFLQLLHFGEKSERSLLLLAPA
jgi:hypothetical protein